MSKIIITLPLPDAKLAANARVHWTVKAKLTEQHRHIARIYASHQLKLHRPKIAGYRLVFYWPDRRKRDKRNAAERCKAYEDGISDWLKQDDSEWEFDGVRFGETDKKRPRVEFHMEEYVEEEEQDCPHCGGIGELPGNPYNNKFPKCHECNGTGVKQ